MTKQKVLLLGATGHTGESILNGLIEDGGFEISILVRKTSTNKPSTLALAAEGYPIIPIDLESEIDPTLLAPYDILISAIGATSQPSQLNLATAAAQAGIKRFLPCAFITVCPPSSVMHLRDQKEQIYSHILALRLPYTIVDVGFWHQLSFPRLPSGRVDHLLMETGNKVYGDGDTPNLLTDLRDIGKFVARIIKDERTLNRKVFTWGDELSQNQIYDIAERVSGESISRQHITNEQLTRSVSDVRDAWRADPESMDKLIPLYKEEYNYSKYIRADNSRENAMYLGYWDARELYPDLKVVSFEEHFVDALAGRTVRPYAGRH